MSERFQEEKSGQNSEFVIMTGQELIDEGKTEALAQQLLGNTDAMIELFGRELTIAEMEGKFKKGLTSDDIIKINKVLGLRLATVDEAKQVFGKEVE
jgi:hypothetical protein